MVGKIDLRGGEIYQNRKILISYSVIHLQETSPRLPPGDFNNTSNHFQRLSKVSFFVAISGFLRFPYFQNLPLVCTILKKMFGISS